MREFGESEENKVTNMHESLSACGLHYVRKSEF